MKKKDLKNLKIIKNGFKRNEIIIYSIALMLVTAGYFNYTANLDNSSIETESKDISLNSFTTENMDISENIKEKKEDQDEEIGDAKLVSNDKIVKEEADYFASTKLVRDTNYADMISTYTKILEDNSIPEPQKSVAMKEITKINDIKNSISVCENILSTKGFEKYVVLVNNDSVNVVVKVKEGLNKTKVAQIQNIISRELNSKIENIHITENAQN